MLEAERLTMVPGMGGRRELVAIAYRDSKSPEAVWHATQTLPADETSFGTWTTWRSLGKPDLPLDSLMSPTVAVNVDGRLEVAVVGTEVFHAWQGPGGDWSDWRPLDTPTAGRPLGGSTLGSNEDGRLELFTKANDGTLWHRWQAEPGRVPWREWHPLGKPGEHEFSLLEASPALASNIDGRLELFVLADDGAVWHRWQNVPNGGWSSWDSLEAPASLEHEPVVVRNHDGRLELFSQGFDGTVWHRWQTRPGRGPWAAWRSLGTVVGLGSKVVAGTQPDGRLLLFAIANLEGGGLEIRQQEQTARNNGWLSEWRPLFRVAEVFPSSASITGLSNLVLASENTRGLSLLCSVASGTGPHAAGRTSLVEVGHASTHSDEMTIGVSFLKKPPEPHPFDPA